jgi:hypothetical protein
MAALEVPAAIIGLGGDPLAGLRPRQSQSFISAVQKSENCLGIDLVQTDHLAGPVR